MSFNYPSSLDTGSTLNDTRVTGNTVVPADHNDLADVAIALETKVGTGASTPTTTGNVLTVTGSGASAWQAPGASAAATFLANGTVKQTQYNARDYGATGNLLNKTDGVTSAGSTTFTSATGGFSSADVGKYAELPGAGASGTTLSTTISSVTNATTAVLAAAASTSATAISYWYGTDDTTALQSMVTACLAAGGGVMYSPPGNYLVSSRIKFIGSNFIFRGAGQGATYFREKVNHNQEIFIVGNGNNNDTGAGDSGSGVGTPCNYVFFEDFTVDGNKTNQTAQVSWAPYSTSATRNLIRFRSDAQSSYGGGCRRVTAVNGIQNGLSCESHAQGSFTECTSENMDQNGMWAENGSQWVIENCYTRNNGQNTTIGGQGLKFASFSGFTCANNTCKGDNGGGIGIQSSADGSVTNNSIYRAGWNAGGTYYAANSIVSSVSDSISITGNTIYASMGHGIYIDGNTYASIQGNTFRRNGQYANNTYSDIYFTYLGASPNHYCSVVGNTFKNDTATFYTNAVAYNIGVYQSATGHDNNTFFGNTFDAPVTGFVDNGLLAANNIWGPHKGINPQAFYNYGYFSSSTQTIDPKLGNYLVGTGFTSSVAVTITNGIAAGQQFTFQYNQDSGNKQLTWAANVKWPGGVAPTFLGTASTQDLMIFTWDGTNWNGLWSGNQALLALKAPLASPNFSGKLSVVPGSNASVGTGTLAAGTATISNTSVTASSLIFITKTSASTGVLNIGTITAGTSFVVNSSLGSDTATFSYWIIN